MAITIQKYEFDFNLDYHNVHFQDAWTTDYYRKGTPYKLLGSPGESNVAIDFDLDQSEVVEMKKVL